jgi:dihydropteroate synthase
VTQRARSLHAATETLALGSRPWLMGIVNATPDSFSDGGGRRTIEQRVDLARALLQAGADLIDIGGESGVTNRPPVDPEEEIERVVPLIERVAGTLGARVSVDTYKPLVARAAIAAGASIVNDVSGLRFDPELARAVAASGAALVLMHSRGRPQTMGADAVYADVAAEVTKELRDALRCATGAGVALDRTIVDPGIGFAKRPAHSYGVLARLPEMAAALDRPVLVGPSRKSFLSNAAGGRPPAERDWATAAAVTFAVLAGAHIVRVHAVAEMVQVVRVAEEIRRHGHQP